MTHHRTTRRAASCATAVALSLTGLFATAGVAQADPPPEFPSCAAFQSPGPDGVVHVQVNSIGNVIWGVTMTPPSKSIGAWNIWTLLGGKKTPSGFTRVTTGA